jgi:hypothetical protein
VAELLRSVGTLAALASNTREFMEYVRSDQAQIQAGTDALIEEHGANICGLLEPLKQEICAGTPVPGGNRCLDHAGL